MQTAEQWDENEDFQWGSSRREGEVQTEERISEELQVDNMD